MPVSETSTEPESSGRLPVIAVTIGDPSGIGPEVVLKAVAHDDLWDQAHPILVGDHSFLRSTASRLNIDVDVVAVREEDGFALRRAAANVLDLANLPAEVEPGVESPAAGRAAAECIVKAVELCKAGKVDAISTAPINKRSLAMGGYDFPGHTEFLAHLTGTKEFRMSFVAGPLRVVLLSTHLPLRSAIDLVRKETLTEIIRFTDRELSRLLGREVRLAVAGLNPHASEGGLFGNEEELEIEPAVRECREDHRIDISGPFSPDTVFLRGHKGEFDAVIACYHDQATIAVKSLSFGESVNVTLGLPIIRTSVDHGTAFDIAGKGVADESSMVAAIRLAAGFAREKLIRQADRSSARIPPEGTING